MNESCEWHEAPAADFAVIGDPVAHSQSPKMHQAAYEALGLPYRYVAIRVSAGKVGEALEHLACLGYRGVNVTVPHKLEAASWVEETDEWVQWTGVANTLNLTNRAGTNTDGPGLLDTLQPYEFNDATALILGAGGSARAVAAVLPSAGFAVSIWNRTMSRAEDLAMEFGLNVVEIPTAGYDLVINTTSASLASESLPIDWKGANPNGLAYDLVYGETPFLREAAAHGMKTLDGKPLLVAQGARSFEWWLGKEAPRDAMMEALR